MTRPQRNRKAAQIMNIRDESTSSRQKKPRSTTPVPTPAAEASTTLPGSAKTRKTTTPAPPNSPEVQLQAPVNCQRLSNDASTFTSREPEKIPHELQAWMAGQQEKMLENMQRLLMSLQKPMTVPHAVTTAGPSEAPSPVRLIQAKNRLHLADVTPSVDYLKLEVDAVRILSRAEPTIKSLPSGKGSRQLVAFFVGARPRLDSDGSPRSEPLCAQLSVWGPVGDAVPAAPRVGDVLRISGFTGCKSTAPFDRWHYIELQSDWTELKYENLQDDGSIPWEKNLNPHRTVNSNASPTTTISTPSCTMTSAQVTSAVKKFCCDCGGSLVGASRRTHCDNGRPH